MKWDSRWTWGTALVGMVMVATAFGPPGCGGSGGARSADDDDDGGGAPGGMGGRGGSDGEPFSVADAPFVSEAEVTRLVQTLAADAFDGRDEGTPGSTAARQYIIEEMQRCGIQPAVAGGYEQPITTGDGVNVVGVVPGTDPTLSGRHVLVSAHYDHLGHCGGAICNGADDNASGVAIMLSVGCAVAARPSPKTVVFASWDAEEPPTFLTDAMGSEFYAAQPVFSLDEMDVAIVLDLVGSDLWPGFTDHFYLGAELSPEVAAALDATVVPDGLEVQRFGLHMVEEQPIGFQPWSDYNGFRNRQRPVLFASNGQNQRYHTPSDELATLNLPKMALEAAYLAGVVRTLAGSPITPNFVAEGSDSARDVAANRRVLSAALAAGGLADALGLGPAARDALAGDLAATEAAGARLASGGSLTASDVAALRSGAQRIMCLAGSTYDENICSAF
ncbi:MAG: M28 family peptidase [Myxococcota bacterium]